MTDSFDINTTPQPDPINIDTGNGSVALTQEIADTRAVRAHFGMSSYVNLPLDEYRKSIAQGDEDALRKQSADRIDEMRTAEANQKVLQLASTQGNTTEAIKQVFDEASKPTDSRSVFEAAYTKKFTDTLPWPEDTKDIYGFSNDAMMYDAYTRKKMEDVDSLVKSQSWPKAIWDTAKQFTQLTSEYSLRGQVPIEEYSLIGGSMNAQALALRNLPFPQFVSKLDAIVDDLTHGVAGGNPYLAARFLQYVLGSSTQDKKIDSLFTTMAPFDALAVLKAPSGVFKTLAARNTAVRASKSILEASKAVPERPPEVAAAAGAGDVQKAAITTVANDLSKITDTSPDTQGVLNTPKQAIDALPSTLRWDTTSENPGNFGQAQVNLIRQDDRSLLEKLLNARRNVAKVERIRCFLDNETAVKAYTEVEAKKYPVLTLLDSSKPIWDPETNIHHIQYNYGYNGAYLETANQAYNVAKQAGIPLAEEPILSKINEHFGIESSKIIQAMNVIRDDMKAGPEMEADVHELNRHAALPDKLTELQTKLDDLQSWHGEKLTEPGIGEINLKGTPGGAQISQEKSGNKYYLSFSKPIDETSDVVRDNLFSSKTEAPRSFFKDWLGWGRTPGETLSTQEVANLAVVDYNKSMFDKIL